MQNKIKPEKNEAVVGEWDELVVIAPYYSTNLTINVTGQTPAQLIRQLRTIADAIEGLCNERTVPVGNENDNTEHLVLEVNNFEGFHYSACLDYKDWTTDGSESSWLIFAGVDRIENQLYLVPTYRASEWAKSNEPVEMLFSHYDY